MGNDKLVNREVLKKVREKFQQKIENAQVVAGQAKAIAPVSEESGTIQEQPFILQGTATANNTSPVDTSPVGKQLEKQGNTIVYNQLIANENRTGNNTSSVAYIQLGYGILNVSTDTTLIIFADLKCTDANSQFYAVYYQNGAYKETYADGYIPTNSYGRKFLVFKGSNYTSQNQILLRVTNTNGEENTLDFKNLTAINLDKWFNGDIPADLISHPEHFSWYYNGDLSYNVGEIRNCAGRYLECGQSRNIWDEVATSGGYIKDDGTMGTGYANMFASTNYIPVISNITYHFKVPYSIGDYGIRVAYYDYNQNFIKEATSYSTNITIPFDAWYIRFSVHSQYGSQTYNNDVTLSIYYLTGDGYDDYYPYVPPVTYYTGTEVLRKAGSAKDTKAPDGTITRNIGSVDLGSLTWQKSSQEYDGVTHYRYYVGGLTDAKAVPDQQIEVVANAICAKYQVTNFVMTCWTTYPTLTDNRGGLDCISIYYRGILTIYDKSFDTAEATTQQLKTALSGVILYYELATPTTEQGTAFSENIQINDYGDMGWLDTSNAYVTIPQGTKLFYPADYVLLIDSLNFYTNGDVTALAKKSDLLPKLSSSSADGTYVLKAVKSGTTITYSWVAEESQQEET